MLIKGFASAMTALGCVPGATRPVGTLEEAACFAARHEVEILPACRGCRSTASRLLFGENGIERAQRDYGKIWGVGTALGGRISPGSRVVG